MLSISCSVRVICCSRRSSSSVRVRPLEAAGRDMVCWAGGRGYSQCCMGKVHYCCTTRARRRDWKRGRRAASVPRCEIVRLARFSSPPPCPSCYFTLDSRVRTKPCAFRYELHAYGSSKILQGFTTREEWKSEPAGSTPPPLLVCARIARSCGREAREPRSSSSVRGSICPPMDLARICHCPGQVSIQSLILQHNLRRLLLPAIPVT